ncbi:MAG: sensor histidine kinase [Actinomycetales bacterium]
MSALRRFDRRGPVGVDRVVALVGAAIYGLALVIAWPGMPVWSAVLSAVAVAVWAALAASPRATSGGAVSSMLGVMVFAGSVAASTSTLGFIPGLMAVVMALAMPALPVSFGLRLAAASAVIVSVAAWLAEAPGRGLINGAVLAAVVVIGVLRRQVRVAAERERLVAAQLVDAHRALAESAARDERARIARDLHDVLAHSLGGLVVQLDALEALVEAGRTGDLAQRAKTARQLAADGLRDARAAVRVLNDREPVDLGVLVDQINDLVATEVALGGDVTAEVADLTGAVTPGVVATFREAAREALTNARKHAPGQPVTLTMSSVGGRIRLIVSNPLGAGRTTMLADSGAGEGLAGMRSRFGSLAGGTVVAGAAQGRFTLIVEAAAA